MAWEKKEGGDWIGVGEEAIGAKIHNKENNKRGWKSKQNKEGNEATLDELVAGRRVFLDADCDKHPN